MKKLILLTALAASATVVACGGDDAVTPTGFPRPAGHIAGDR